MERDERYKRILRGAAVATAAMLVSAGTAIARLIRRADPHFRFNTMFGHAVVFTVEDGAGRPVRMLAVGRSVQSGTYLGEDRFELPFEYYRAFERAVAAKGDAHDILMLGGGAFAYPKHALIAQCELHMDVIEADPAIIDLARRWFFLEELERRVGERLHILTGDAHTYLATCGKTYDVIINDLFASAQAVADFATDDGVELVKAHLNKGGLYLVNVVTSHLDYARLAEVGELLERHFGKVEMVECTDLDFSDDENYLFVCHDKNDGRPH